MCIRDSGPPRSAQALQSLQSSRPDHRLLRNRTAQFAGQPCLLYTSDAADERSSVDLGGRRIIKKKNKETLALSEQRGANQ